MSTIHVSTKVQAEYLLHSSIAAGSHDGRFFSPSLVMLGLVGFQQTGLQREHGAVLVASFLSRNKHNICRLKFPSIATNEYHPFPSIYDEAVRLDRPVKTKIYGWTPQSTVEDAGKSHQIQSAERRTKIILAAANQSLVPFVFMALGSIRLGSACRRKFIVSGFP
jgi:hypothetical protein